MHKFVDLFAGIGGLRIPFDELGMKCVFSSEIDKFARITYEANFNEIPHGDIREINAANIPDHDLLIAGFPCQSFSIAGNRLGFNDTRGTMFFQIERILREKRPSLVLLENVKGLTSHDKGNTLKTIINILEDIGYKCSYKVLNAHKYGMIQKRQRIYIICSLEKKFDAWPSEIESKQVLGDILENNVDDKYTLSHKAWSRLQRKKEDKSHSYGYGLFNSQSLSVNTISARYYKDGCELLIEQEGKNPRRLVPRESARLQGFPDSFIIDKVSNTQAYKQLGNSVCVPIIRLLANGIKQDLL